MELENFNTWYVREDELHAEDQYVTPGVDVLEIIHERETVAEARDLQEMLNNLDSSVAKLLHKLDAGLFSVINGKLGHLPDMDPFKEYVRAGLLFAAAYMTKYLDIMQPGFHKDIEQYRGAKLRQSRKSKLVKAAEKFKVKTGEQMLQTFNHIVYSLGTIDSQGNVSTKSNYRLYDGELYTPDGTPPARSGLALCDEFANELVVCGMKCPGIDSESDKKGRSHRKRLALELKRDVKKAIEQRLALRKKVEVEKDEYMLIQQIAYHYRSLNRFVLEQTELCKAYFEPRNCELNVEAAVECSLGQVIGTNIQLDPLAYSLRDTVKALRYFSALSRSIPERQQVADNQNYVEAVLGCMTSSFMYDPFHTLYGNMIIFVTEERIKKPKAQTVIDAWRQDPQQRKDEDKGEQEEQKEEDQDNVVHTKLIL